MSVYLDYNASAPIDERVLAVMIDVYKNAIGNADSRTHNFGENARKIVENAREQVASLLGVDKGEVFFTSGSTESNNIAIQGLKEYALQTGKKHIITTAIEHKSVLETAKYMQRNGFTVDFISPEPSGRINEQAVLDKIGEKTLLVSVMHANNETGIIQPVKEIGDFLTDKDILFHIDATQTCGKLVPEIKGLKYNMLSLSAHKLSGPQGVGTLILRKKKYKLPPVKQIIFGGQQERGIRPGTIPVALVAGLGRACQLAEIEYHENIQNCREIKKDILELLNNSKLKIEVNGEPDCCMPNTLNISIKGVESEALMLSTKDFCGISNGSACTSSDYKPSYVLSSMNLDNERISQAVRLSWGGKSVKEKILTDLSLLIKRAEELVF